jgi:hypothetical protein
MPPRPQDPVGEDQIDMMVSRRLGYPIAYGSRSPDDRPNRHVRFRGDLACRVQRGLGILVGLPEIRVQRQCPRYLDHAHE